jgi:hypothetical protein
MISILACFELVVFAQQQPDGIVLCAIWRRQEEEAEAEEEKWKISINSNLS